MELMNAWVWFIGVPVIIFLLVLHFGKRRKFTKGTVVANADIVEQTPYFKRLQAVYKTGTVIAFLLLMLAITGAFMLASRPATVETVSPEIHNRDIMLCLDISSSVDALNMDVVGELKEVVKELNGERFGITIFNGQAVLLVPLTTDYNYVLESLDRLEDSISESMKLSADMTYSQYIKAYATIDEESYNFKYDGTYAEEGSSFIGDGLASALYSFPDLKTNKERSRMIIFTTDNELNGVPYVTISEAARLCELNDVKVFAVTPDIVTDEITFKQAMLSTGGGYYKGSNPNAFTQLIKDIRKIKTSDDGIEQMQTLVTDRPTGWFITLLICMSFYWVFNRILRR